MCMSERSGRNGRNERAIVAVEVVEHSLQGGRIVPVNHGRVGDEPKGAGEERAVEVVDGHCSTTPATQMAKREKSQNARVDRPNHISNTNHLYFS